MAYSFEQKTHKSKGRAGKKPHPVGASPHSGARKNKLTDALRKREADLAKRKIKPKKKPKRRSATRGGGQTSSLLDSLSGSAVARRGGDPSTYRKIPTIKPKPGPSKRRPTMEEQRKSGSNVIIDYDSDIPIIKPKPGPSKRRPTVKEQRESGADVIIDYEQLENLRPKKYGGKIIYKMTGGQVVDASYD